MKRLVISLSITLAVSLVLVGIFATTGTGTYRVPRPTRPPERDIPGSEGRYEGFGETGRLSPYGTAIGGQKAEPDPLADPNKVKAKVKKYPDMVKALYDLDRKSQNVLREWMQRDAYNKPKLAKYVHDQVILELRCIRKLALAEGAVKTVTAIDGLSLDRLERFTRLIKEMEKAGKTTMEPNQDRNLRGSIRTRSRYDNQGYQQQDRRRTRR